jgi:hypothetical protein
MAKGSTEAAMTKADLSWPRMLWRLERLVKQEACDFLRRAAKDLRPSTRAKALRGPPTEQQVESPRPLSRRFRGANQHAEYEIIRLCQMRIRYKEKHPKEGGSSQRQTNKDLSSGRPGAHLDLLVERMLRPLAQAQQVQSQQIAQMTEVARKLQHQQQQTTAELTMAMQSLHEQHETWTQIFTEHVDP